MPKIFFAATFIFLILNSYFLLLPSPAFAAMGIATTYEVSDSQAVDGDVLCFSSPDSGGKIVRCQKTYDDSIFGVQTTDPSVVLKQTPSGKAVVQEGWALVNVTTLGGPIKVGDYITSSPISGKAQKAEELLGYILGKSLVNFTDSEGQNLSYNGKNLKSGQIEVSLKIGPLGVLPRGTFLDKIGFAMVRGTQTPAAAGLFLRYVSAGLMLILVSFFAFNNFGRNIGKGIESIGRNPLAQSQIQLTIIINTILIAGTIIGAIVLGLVIIRI